MILKSTADAVHETQSVSRPAKWVRYIPCQAIVKIHVGTTSGYYMYTLLAC